MRIIHFSDFHLEGDKLADAKSIVDSLITAFKDIHQTKNIDLILFSGDLIDKGGETFSDIQNGFKTFQDKVIDPILAALDLPHNRFIFTIGNHDVDTKTINKKDETSLRKKLKDEQSVYNYMGTPNLQIPRLTEYNKFRDEYWKKSADKAEIKNSLFQFGIKLLISGKRVGINCLNTAWRYNEFEPDKHNMILGKSQITKMKTFFGDCNMIFSVGHYSLSMMKDFEVTTLEELVAKNYEAYFCGHTHDTDGVYVERPQGIYFFFTSPGMTDKNTCADIKYKNGFLVVDYEQDDGYVEVRRYYQNDNEEFVQDHNYNDGTGVWKKSIPATNIELISRSLFLKKRDGKFLTNDAIKKCIKELRNPNNDAIFLCALSGLGKTRILREAFDDGESHNNYFYCEFPGENSQLLTELKRIILNHRNESGLIVLDNCPYQVLNDAVGCRDDHDSKFRIIGVNNEYYDIKNRLKDNIQIITLNQDQMRDMISDFVDHNVPAENGDSSVRNNIKKIADGFPGWAIDLVAEFKKGKKVNVHTIDRLVVKLLNLNEEKDKDKLKVLQTLALFQPFPHCNEYEEASRFIRENEKLTRLFGKTPEEKRCLFREVINRYDDSLIEVTGSWLNVRPFPLALWLVSKWFETCDKELVEGIVTDIENWKFPLREKVVAGLCRRLEYMQDSVPARDLVSRLMKIGSGLFSSEKVICSDLGSRLFLAMSSVNPVAVASCLHNILMPKTIKWVKGTIRDDVRRNLVNALEKLCFDAESYDYGSKVMALLAVAENETWANNATGQFVQLFHIMLPGTQASLEERIKTLQYLREQGKPYRDLTLRCFDNAFAYGYFVRDGESAQFGLENKTDYQPQNNEIVNYWESCRDMLMELLGEDTSILKGVKEIVVRHVLNWDSIGMLERMFPLVEKVCDTDGGKWEELYTTLNNVEERYWAMRSDGFVTRLEALKEQIRPRTFNQRLIDARQVFYKRRSNSRDDSGEDLFRPLAKAFLEEKIYLSVEEVSEIAGSEQYHDIWFSPALAEIVSDSQLKELMGVFLSVIEQNGENNFKGGFVFRVCYQFRDKGIVRNFIRQIFDDGYYDLYVRLLSTCETDSFVSYNQIKEHINKGELDTTYVGVYLQRASLFEWNQISSVIKMFRKDYISEVTKLGDFIISHRYDRGLRKDSEIKVIAKDVMLDYPLTDDRGNNNWEFTQLVKSILENEHDENFARGLNKKLIKFLGNGYAHGNFEGIYNLLLTNYADAIWGDFEKAFVDDEYCLFRFNVKDELGSGLGFGEGTLFKTNGDKVKKMCEKYPDNAPCNISEMIPVFDSDENGIRFSDWFMWLLDNYADRTGVLSGLDANLNTFSWTGSVIPLLNDKKTCLERIANHKNAKVRKWVDSHLNDVNELLEKEMDEEAYGRFSHS